MLPHLLMPAQCAHARSLRMQFTLHKTSKSVDFFVEWFLITNGHEPDVIYQAGAARQQLMPAPLPWQHPELGLFSCVDYCSYNMFRVRPIDIEPPPKTVMV